MKTTQKWNVRDVITTVLLGKNARYFVNTVSGCTNKKSNVFRNILFIWGKCRFITWILAISK